MENNIITNYDSYTCPSFSSYSQTAIRAATENHNADESNDEEFEFNILHDENEHVVYPVFNKDLGFNDELKTVANDNDEESVVVSLETLFLQDRLNDDEIQSCSSSEADELDDIPPETYCVWRPKATESPAATPSCKKSKSTGSASKRWKIRDFMRRSNSDGKDSFVFLTPPKDEDKKSLKDKDNFDILAQPKPRQSVEKSGKVQTKWSPSAHEALYVQNRAAKEENRRKSYLPYKRDLVGFFSNVSVLGKGVPHF